MANVPDVSSVVNSPLASLMASQAVQGPDLAARLGAQAFRLREEHRQAQVNDTEATSDSAVVSAQGHQSQEEAAPFRKKKAGPEEQAAPRGPGRTGTHIDMVA
jgi:hypothetical protein